MRLAVALAAAFAPTVASVALATEEGNGPAMAHGEELETLLRRHVEVLAGEIGERSVRRPAALARAADYVRAVFREARHSVTEQSYDYAGLRVANIVAVPPGTDEAAPFYVVGAHYDTVAGTPGADDNASGVAVLLALAARFADRPPPVPLRLVAFTLEEPPAFATRHQGSRVYVRTLRRNGAPVRGAIVLEMVGYTRAAQSYPLVLRWAGYPRRGDYIGIVANRRSRAFGRTVLRGFERTPDLPVESLFVPFDGWLLPDTRLSDHASFWDAGWPAVMVTDTAYFRNPHYHGAGDRPETLDIPFMGRIVQALERALAMLAEG